MGRASNREPDAAVLPAIPAVSAISAASAATTVTTAAATSTAATMAAASAAVSAATAAAAATSTTTAASAFGLRPSLIHHQVPTTEILTVQRIDRAIRIFVVAHFNESETTRLARKTIADQVDTRGSYTDLREPLVKLIFRRGKRKIPDVELLHLPLLLPGTQLSSRGARQSRRASYTGSPGSPATTGARQALQRSRAWSRKLTAFATGKSFRKGALIAGTGPDR
jgi:hypothetical protein